MRIAFVAFILTLALSTNAQLTISGTVKNYDDSAFYINEGGNVHNFTMAWLDSRIKIRVDKNKHFKVVIPETSIGFWVIKTTDGGQLFHLIKGEDLQLVADFSQKKPLHAIGKNADDFNFFAFFDGYQSQYYADNHFNERTNTKNIDSALFYRKQFAAFEIEQLNKYRNDHKMSDTYYDWLYSTYTYEPFERTMVENTPMNDTLDDVAISKIMEKGINDEYAALHVVQYNNLVDFYILSTLRKKNKGFKASDRFNFVADGNMLSGSTKEVNLTRILAWLITSQDSIYNPLFAKYDKIVLNEDMKRAIVERRNDYASVDDDNPIDSIEQILGKYKGKVAYVDFWASWCVPCRFEMPNAAAIREKLKGKDIVFIYLAYHDKKNAWIKARNQLGIEGEHYLLNGKTNKEAAKLFAINGIPHYAIFDKEGKMIEKDAAAPLAAYAELLKLTEKK